MKITFLGTGTSQGVPVIACPCSVCHSDDIHDKRLRTSALVTDLNGNNVLVDIGPDFRSQMLRHDVQHIEGILITHAHRDHVAGLDDIRAFNWVQDKPMDLYGNNIALHTLQRDYHYIFEPHLFPGLPEANLHDVTNTLSFTIGLFTITPIRGMHKDLPVLGFLFEEHIPNNNKVDSLPLRLAYITDMNYIEPSEQAKLFGVDILVINALRKEHHFSHFCLPEALEIIQTVAPRKAFLTHMSHQMGFHHEVQNSLPENVFLAFDNLTVSLNR